MTFGAAFHDDRICAVASGFPVEKQVFVFLFLHDIVQRRPGSVVHDVRAVSELQEFLHSHYSSVDVFGMEYDYCKIFHDGYSECVDRIRENRRRE